MNPLSDQSEFVRSAHPYAYKSGEWAQIVGEVERGGRRCWLIVWADGETDEWVIDDPHAGYERKSTFDEEQR